MPSSLRVSDLRTALGLVRAVRDAASPAAALAVAADGLGTLIECERVTCAATVRAGVHGPAVHALTVAGRHRACLTLPVGGQRIVRITLHRADRPFEAPELAVLDALGPHLAPALADPLAGTRVTVREREVLALVAEGATNAQIARRLGMRPRTVEKHLEHLFAKLGVPSRTAAAARVRGITH